MAARDENENDNFCFWKLFLSFFWFLGLKKTVVVTKKQK
jgi:hypothetical protein